MAVSCGLTLELTGGKAVQLNDLIGRYLMPTNGGLLIAGMCSQKYAAKMEKGGQSGCTGCCLATQKKILTTLTGTRGTTHAGIFAPAGGPQTTRTSRRERTKRLAIVVFQGAAIGGRW